MAQKSVLITGCSKGGIGDALAQEFHARGLRVFATARSPAKIEHLKERGIETLRLDVTSPEDVSEAVKKVASKTGGSLDFLILNAGTHHWMPFSDCSIDEVRQMLETNIISIYTVTQPFLPLLIKARGLIATIGSINQVLSPPYQTAYNACKHAINGITDTLRVELASLGVRVVNIVTGSVDTAQHAGAVSLPESSYYAAAKKDIESKKMMNQGWKQRPEEYAKKVVGDLLGSRPGPWIWRGGMATTIWLVTAILPKGWMDDTFAKNASLGLVKPPRAT
ncbi:hypothetical protein LTR62_001740 [Meristemomyces frigidus]|uniref:NADPH-dependent 1-acyldihydroxyacetone phosphate reductase n=1 Tax=Meristemomyces frigidus TaxID=1508187 RepID=A0AAN7TGD2_9PEZI|nr:hypothetical protein LTR62_001740 [Meristemomyces frigidus]